MRGQRSDQLAPHGPLSATELNQLLTASEIDILRDSELKLELLAHIYVASVTLMSNTNVLRYHFA